MTKIFLLNGPAGSGKDTAAAHLQEYFEGKLVKFATPLKKAATAIYCDGDEKLFEHFDTFERKGIPEEIFFGKSCRQVQINISEYFLKPMHGEDVFGQILKQRIKRASTNYNLFFVSDSGFAPEAEVLIKEFGSENVVLIRIHRDGHTFDGDSRNYINLDQHNVRTYDIVNPNEDVGTFLSRLREVVAYITGETK